MSKASTAPEKEQGKTAEEILEEARAKAAAEVEAARAEAAAILEAAKVKAEEEAAKAAEVKAAADKPKTVKIRLFKDNDKYKDDVFVAVNGKSFQIKRGEDVEVPDFVADLLEQSAKQDAATANLIDRESARYQADAAARNI